MSLLIKKIVSKSPLLRRAFSHHHYDDGHVRMTLNDCPIPEGGWHDYHNLKTLKYNLFLGSSIVCCFGTIGFITSTGVVNFNYTPPREFE